MPRFPTSGQVSFSDLVNTFGGPTDNIDIKKYYRGGPYVQDSTLNKNIPKSGELIFPNHFWGSRNVYTSLSNLTVLNRQRGSSIQRPYFRFRGDGRITSSGGTIKSKWHRNAPMTSIYNLYEFKFIATSRGINDIYPRNVLAGGWLTFPKKASSFKIGFWKNGLGTRVKYFSLKIREKNSKEVVSTATYKLIAQGV